MNAKTLEAVRKHGETLLAIFPNATERDPIALCKKLRRIETAVSRVTTDYCNGTASMEQTDAATDKARSRVIVLLGITDAVTSDAIIINRDPRGYALKIDDVWMRDNRWEPATGIGSRAVYKLHRDMGGYGIIAPDLTEE